MKKKIRKIVTATLIVVLAISVMAPVAIAASRTAIPMAYNYTIAAGTGEREWCGHCKNAFWEGNGNYCKWFTSITDPTPKTITASLIQYNWSIFWPDATISTQELEGSGVYVEAGFYPNTSKSYYTVVKTDEPYGVGGRTNVFYG